MKRSMAWFLAMVLCLSGPVYALYSVSDHGDWPSNWPKEMESLRKQSRTLVGPTVENVHYAIPFKHREDFETAWPHILSRKTKGAPIILVRGPNFFLGDDQAVGVIIHTPPLASSRNPATPERPIAGVTEPRVRWMNTTYLEVVVDGTIVDLNRIPLPADTVIVDERFKQ